MDWTTVLTAAIPTVPATLAVVLGEHNRRTLRTPSSETIGNVVERAHDLAAVSTAALVGAEPGPSYIQSVERINGDPDAAVHVNGEEAA